MIKENNVKALGALNVSKKQPFFLHHDQQVFVVNDVLHLIKSVRKNLISHDITFEGGTASWKHIEDVYKIDANSDKARTLCKITPDTLNLTPLTR